jgi:hypothetical protein
MNTHPSSIRNGRTQATNIDEVRFKIGCCTVIVVLYQKEKDWQEQSKGRIRGSERFEDSPQYAIQ